MIHYYPIACVFSVLSGLSTLPTLVPGFCIRPHPSHALDDLSPCHRSGEICILKKGAAHLLVGIPSSHYYLRSLSRTSGTLLLPRFSGPPRGSQEDFPGRERAPREDPNKTLVLRIYLLSLPRKSEKSVKIGTRKPYGEPYIWGPSGGGIYIGNTQVKYSPPASLLASVFSPKGGHGALGALGQPPKGLFLQRTMAPLLGGGANTAARRLLQRVGPPHGPPLTLGGSFLGSFTSKFTNNLGWIG